MPMYRAELVDRGFYWRKRRLHDKSLVLYLPFDKDDGSYARDRSGYNNHGTIYGATRVAGKFGNALSFDGIDDCVKVPDAPVLNPSVLTVCAWVRLSAYSSTFQSIVNKGSGGATRYQLRVDPTPTNLFEISVGDGTTFTMVYSTTVPALGSWYFVAATADGSVVKIYVNGVLENYKSQTAPITPVAQFLVVGARDDAKQWFNGLIDEVRVYNRALTAGEIRRIMYMRGV
jgi:hypothetical protein